MHWVIDLVALLILLFFILSGWHKGLLLSVLGIVRVILAYGAAFFAGRHIGFWLGGIANRPRIVTIPVVAGLTFVVITFVFHIVMTNIRDELRHKEEKEDYTLPWYSSLGGSLINTAGGLISMIFIFWLGELFTVGVSGVGIPGGNRSHFGQFARRSIYEAAYMSISRDGKESQAAAMARVVSNPALGLVHLENVFQSDSVKQLLSDKTFAEAMLSGDPALIEQNESLQQLLSDRETMEHLRSLGLLSGQGKKSDLYEKLSKFGDNENIQISMENLKTKGLLTPDKVLILIRDPDFDIIVGELLK